MVKVMLVDDQRLFIEGVQAILSQEEDIEVVGLAANGLEILDNIEALEPDIILMDVYMPNSNGIEATFQIKNRFPHIKVILLTAFAEEELIIYGLNAGADGFLLKELDREQLTRAIRDVSYEEVVISGKAAKILAKKIRDLKYDKKQILQERLSKQQIHLTQRELEIADLLAEGATNKYIAQSLTLSEGTIKNYISDLYHKLDIHNRKDVISFIQKLVT
jgi:DNA-binding NarL/FixJ family response regulator